MGEKINGCAQYRKKRFLDRTKLDMKPADRIQFPFKKKSFGMEDIGGYLFKFPKDRMKLISCRVGANKLDKNGDRKYGK